MAYDPTTTIGYLRLLLSDTDDTSRIFTDAELTAFLAQAGNTTPNSPPPVASSNVSVYVAAWLALGALVVSRSLLAKVVLRDGYETQEQAIADLLKVKKDMLDQINSIGGVVYMDFSLTDEHLLPERPDWRELGQIVVE